MAKALMIQGTMSNAGKGLIAAGLCRIFWQDGYRVAPFKSQNMALNSYITRDGLEMGRAQVVQAEAAGVEPDVAMNPILLKPTTDVGSQVIVNGTSIGNMKAKDYFAYKKKLIPEIKKAYEKLDREYDIIVIEGAGSPAEINLKKDDIVNMGMARMAKAPVLLAGDIDRGGVFAQLYGTVALLEPEEKQMVKGLIVNKFRGDSSILEPGIRQLEALCGLPVVGVVPYMKVEIDDEDSLSSRLECSGGRTSSGTVVDIAVIRLPRISNFTDFTVFSCIPGVSLRYAGSVSQLGTPDLVILPGTKNTISDLLWMRQNGLEAAILKLADQQVPVWGICGGYQMLGERLEDMQGMEGEAGRSIAGMGLFPAKTMFEPEKARAQVEGAFSEVEGIFQELSGKSFSGYEIHMGRTVIDREHGPADTARFFHGKLEICRPLSYLLETQSQSKQMHQEGWSRGNVYGSYVHGVFDGEGIAELMVNALRRAKGLPKLEDQQFDYAAYKEQQYDRLADGLRKSLDMDAIYQILNKGIR
ncbi:MAG: cobyric acid synthase [Lachnospiraceae bacterium]|nr:cobyric acid synthase [Lachnospiraceae bacterium]